MKRTFGKQNRPTKFSTCGGIEYGMEEDKTALYTTAVGGKIDGDFYLVLTGNLLFIPLD